VTYIWLCALDVICAAQAKQRGLSTNEEEVQNLLVFMSLSEFVTRLKTQLVALSRASRAELASPRFPPLRSSSCADSPGTTGFGREAR